jgi:hypothetical protein
MIMKKIVYSLVACAFAAVVFSCADEALDPYQTDKVKKGTLLALRGTQLENIYVAGVSGAEFNPRDVRGDEEFVFDAEFLSGDPESLESFDIYVIKRVKTGTRISLERVFLRNVPFSAFKNTDDYVLPWVTVSISLEEVLEKIDITLPLAQEDVDFLLDVYKFGINIESDLNLTDGSQVLAEDIVATGLFQSDQFYPAQKLTYSVLNYCPEDLAGPYTYETVVTAVGDGGDISGCAGSVTGEGELAVVSLGKYSISDVTFGQYDCAWGDDPATGATLANSCDLLSFGGSDQYDLVYTISSVSVSADGTQLSFKWKNDFGDAGNTVLTRTDDKLWPTTLYTEE